MEERLCDFRENNLIRPLESEELEFVFGTENLELIEEKINNNKYGSYLIGGAVGTGKSSLINIALGQSRQKNMQVNIKFYNEDDSNENFLRVVMEELIDSVDKNISISENDELERKIASCKKWLYYNEEEQYKEEQEDKYEEEINKKEISKAGYGVNLDSNLLPFSGNLNKDMLSRVELLFPPTAALPQIKSDISFILSILTCCFLRHVFFCPLDHFPSFPYSLFVTNRKRERTAPPTVRSFSSPIQVLQKQVRCRVMP